MALSESDYENLYEAALLEYRSAEASLRNEAARCAPTTVATTTSTSEYDDPLAAAAASTATKQQQQDFLPEKNSDRLALSRLLVARANRLSVLAQYCSDNDKKNSRGGVGGSGDNKDGAASRRSAAAVTRELWNILECQMSEDAAALGPQMVRCFLAGDAAWSPGPPTKRGDDRSAPMSYDFRLPGGAGIDDDDDDDNDDDDKLVDRFFEAYPHAMKPEAADDESLDNNDGNDDDEVQIVGVKRRATTALDDPKQAAPLANPSSDPPKQQQQRPELASDSSLQTSAPRTTHSSLGQFQYTPPEALPTQYSHHPSQLNPGPSSARQPESFPPPPPPPPLPLHDAAATHGRLPRLPACVARPTSHTTHHHEPTCSWDEHRNASGSFQTAREYAQATAASASSSSSSAGIGSGAAAAHQPPPSRGELQLSSRQQNPYQYQQQLPPPPSPPHHPTYPAGYNPYLKQPPPPPQPQPQQLVPGPPSIRESLQRKFQPHQRKSNAMGGATVNGTGSGGGATAKSHRDSNGDDGDDLPEELKRYGKELVDKISAEIMDEGDPVKFDEIAGLKGVKRTIDEMVCLPMRRPDLFSGLRRAPNGLLLFGPPGTGKTLIGKAIAHESKATFFSISSSSLTSKWIGEGEKLVRTLFAVAAYRQPSVVFIDEIDSLLTQRKADENEASRRIKTEFMVHLDGTGTTGQGRVLLIGATNRPQELDDAIRRRFVKRLYIRLPEEADRESLLRVLLEKNRHELTDDEIKDLAKETEGFSGADLKSLSTEAAMGPIRQLGLRALEVDAEDVPPISFKHFRKALRSTKPSVASSDLKQYEDFDKQYGFRLVEDDDSLDMEDEN